MKVSVIVPVYNVEKYIARCLESIICQSLQDFEILIVDDCGHDNSMSIASEYAQKDSRIRIVHHDVNHGLMIARRTGYTNAKGEYVVFVDSDDYLPDDALEYLWDSINQSGADIVIGNLADVKPDGLEKISITQPDGIYNREDALKLFLTRSFRHSLCGRIFKRRLFLSPTIIDVYENLTNSEDLLTTAQLLIRCDHIMISNRIVYKYVSNPSSSTQSEYTEDKFRNIIFATNTIWHILHEQCESQLLNNYLIRRVKDICILGVPKKIIQELDTNITSMLSFSNFKKLYGFRGIAYFLIFRNSIFRNFFKYCLKH